MNRQEWIESQKGKMNKQMLMADIPMCDRSEKGSLFVEALPTAIERAPFPENEKMKPVMLLHLTKMMSAMTTYSASIKRIKKAELVDKDQSITKETFLEIQDLLKSNHIDSIGYVELDGADVFKHLTVPYKHMIIFTAHQDYEEIKTSPSIESQAEVAKIYGVTGNASNKLSDYLNKKGYGAMPSHSLGGSVDYTKLARRAGLGEIGRHGLLIEPVSGANHRIGGVFCNIDNLSDFMSQENEHEWIKDFCAKCGKCIKKCPSKAIWEKPKTNEDGYVTCIETRKCGKYFGEHFGCNICVAECPFSKVGYDQIKKTYRK